MESTLETKLNLSKRTWTRLALLSETSPEKWTVKDLRDICRLGSKSINEIRKELKVNNIELKED